MTSRGAPMTMRRIGIGLAAALGATLLTGAPAGAAGDVNGPPCADITNGGGTWDGATLTFAVDLSAPACRAVTYTLYASTTDPDSTSATFLSTTQYVANGNRVTFSLPVEDDDSTAECTDPLYVYATTSTRGRVFDRAPDTGYVQVADSGAGCGSGGQVFH